MTKEQAKLAIQKLVNKYEEVLRLGTKNKYTEEETKKDFIVPLFTALGWDMQDRNEVTAEEHISGDRVDYGFYINGRSKFYLETKPLKADINKEDYANQAIRYSWNKGVSWAVLSDFETIKVFYSSSISKHLSDKLYFTIHYSEYLDRFEQLWQLSKEAFEEDLIDRKAREVGKALEKVSVTALLYKDLNICRDLLTTSLSLWNENLDQDLLDEGVHKLLNRLVFIRSAEDRGIEDPTLRPLVREWKAMKVEKEKPPLYKLMVAKFRELDKIYNSNLFSPHPFENWEEHDNITEKVIEVLYGKSGYYEYDFKIIPADILGAVYENYLGYRLSKSKKEEGDNLKKRKEHGIYYTPTSIVDYIVRNTLIPVLDKCNGLDDVKRIKVIDPACGSGSFLMKAVEVIHEYYKKFGQQDNVFTKIQILKNNIYGVDLDERAVEIARLNLLIHILDRKTVLPSLSGNIKNGNSLIYGSGGDLKKYFGTNYLNKKPLNWEEEFPEVFKQGGFDVIIGNPPYVGIRELSSEDKKYFEDKYKTAKEQYDLYILFIEKSVDLLMKQGNLGFIVPNKFLITKYGLELRRLIAENTKLIGFRDYSEENVFPEASVYPVVIILQKEVDTTIKIDKNFSLLDIFGFSRKDELLQKIESIENKVKLKVWRPLATSKDIISGDNIIVSNREVGRYCFIETRLGDLKNKRSTDVEPNKIILKKLTYNLEASLDEKGLYPINTTYCIKSKESDVSLEYILAIINSRLLSYFVRKKYSATALRGGFIELRVFQIEDLPILKVSDKDRLYLAKLATQALSFFSQTKNYSENSEKWNQLKSEIEKTDKSIDQKVYELYGLTEEEIKIIDGSNKN